MALAALVLSLNAGCGPYFHGEVGLTRDASGALQAVVEPCGKKMNGVDLIDTTLEHFAPRWLNRDSGADDAGRALRRTAGHDFAVVVATDQLLLAELDVLLLRPQSPGSILQHADIDNRLKTLFDALRHPGKEQEVPAGWLPTVNEQPLHCLLDDDRLISRVNVDTDGLLNPDSADEVALTIRVQVRASSPTWGSASLIS